MHIGQHGEADLGFYQETKKVTETEYKSLLTELKSIYERYAIAQKVYNTLTRGVNEEVSDDEARVIRIQQIYVKSEETARVVQQKLRNGSGFDVDVDDWIIIEEDILM